MSWPQSQDYNEAIQNPRTCFKDAELSKGQAATNAFGMPLPCSGNFADVYQVHCPETNTRWAVKCFTRGDPNSLRQCYARIDEHLQQVKLPFAVGFRYLDEGIRVRGQWHPVLKMQWVEGFTLNQFVRDHLDKPKMLDALLQIWVRMAKRLREADLAHADLQHGNVLLVPASTGNALSVKLIDYDGMWVPALAGQQSGEVGHPAYQHPQRLREGTYSREVDRFPLLVVAAALRCLRVVGRSLWEKFDNGDNLLFREVDLAAPERSPLFAELNKIQDGQAKMLIEAVGQGCRQPLERAPFLDALLPEAAPAPKSVSVVAALAPQPVPIPIGLPPPVAMFAEIGGAPAGPSGRRDGKPFWQKGAIAGGLAAVLLTTVLVIALSGGDKNKPDRPDGTDPKVVQKDNSKDTKRTDRSSGTKKTDRVPVPQLSLAKLPELQLAPGTEQPFEIQVNGVNGAADFKVELADLPAGVKAERISSDPRTGRAVWRLKADVDAPAGDTKVSVTASVGEVQAQGGFRLNVERPAEVVSVKRGQLVVVPTSEEKGQTWRYTMQEPAKDWQEAAFDDSSWKQGEGVFGSEGLRGGRTTWASPDIWLRRTFELKDTNLTGLHLRILHDEDAEVYVNGKLVASVKDYITDYTELALSDEARRAFRLGRNTLAVHCKQTNGAQFIDVGFVLLKVVVPTSEEKGQTWRYTMQEPAKDWQEAAFDDSSWKQGEGVFGSEGLRGGRTTWASPDIWLRRTFELKDTNLTGLHLRILHDEDAEVYVNGKLVASVKDYILQYTRIPLSEEAKRAFRLGRNTLAVHCKQTNGAQYIDVGFVIVAEE